MAFFFQCFILETPGKLVFKKINNYDNIMKFSFVTIKTSVESQELISNLLFLKKQIFVIRFSYFSFFFITF